MFSIVAGFQDADVERMVSDSGKAKLGPLIERAAAFPQTGSSRAAMMGRWARLALVFAAVLAAQAASASQANTAGRSASPTGPGGGAEARNPDLVVAQLDDAAAWEHAKAANSLDELQAFKHFFPTSPHIAEADKAIAALQAAAEEAKRKEAEAEKAKQAAAETEKRKQADAERAKEAAAAAAAEEEQRKEAEAEKAKAAAAAATAAEEQRKAAEAETAKAAAAAAAAAEEQRKEAEAEKAKAAAAAAAAAEERRKEAEAEKAKAAAAEEEQRKEAAKALEETCQREAADVADYVKARSADALSALRSRAACPKTFAAIDKGLRDVQAQECDSERDQVRDLGTDLDALKKAVAGFACEAVAAAARGRIAQLEQEAARIAKACDDAKYEVDNKIDGFAAGARERLAAYLTRTECPDARADAQQRINDIDERVSNAQDQLKKLGCYKAEPASKRFDGETEAAIARFQRGAKLSVDGTRLTPDFMQTLAAYTGDDACPALASIPPAEAPSETPRERPREAPRAPLRQRAEPEPRAEPHKRRQEAEGGGPAQPRHAAPAAPAAAPSAAKPQVFIPN